MNSNKLFTIGYEGRDIEEFIDQLKGQNVTRLIDVREIPISRKKGFSKSALRERLNNENIDYVHMKSLGSPSSIRNKLKLDWNYDRFFESYSNYLSTNVDIIEEIHEYISDGTNCIMCFERAAEKCHRSVVANRIKEYDGNGLRIKLIFPGFNGQ